MATIELPSMKREERSYSLQNFQKLINVKGSILEQSSSSASAVATQDTQKKEALICVINNSSYCCHLDNTNTNLLASEPSEGGQLVESCIIQKRVKEKQEKVNFLRKKQLH